MTAQGSALSYAVRFRILLKYTGQLCLVLSVLTVVPLTVSLIFGEFHISQRYGIVIAGLALFGGAVARLEAPRRLQVNEGMTIVAAMFLLTPLIMAYPMTASGMSYMDALFEAVSAGTTTGLSTRASVEGAPATFLFARAWMQWYGGLGIIIFTLALVMQPGITAKGLAVAEADPDDLVGGTKAHARRVFLVYCILTAAGILALMVFGVGFFDSMLYTFAAVSTGGFAPHNGSLSSVAGWAAGAVVVAFCFLGSLPFTFYHKVRRDKLRVTVNLLQVAGILGLGIILAVLLGLHMRVHGSEWSEAVYHSFLMAFSAQTTAGFSTLNVGEMDPGAKLLLMPSMLIGGGVGSTAGGFKILRLLILLRLLQLVVHRACLARHAVVHVRLEDRRLDEGEINDALLLVLLYIGVVVASWFPFTLMGYDPLDSLFEVVSATGTVGLSTGISSAGLPALLKLILCADMLLGRLEIIVWFVMLNPKNWFGRRVSKS